MKVFITGATGYIGEQLALALAAHGFEVAALVRTPDKAGTLRDAGISLLKGDLDSIEVLEKGMHQCQVVFHLAAYARVWPKDDAIFKKINVEGTRHVAEAALKNNVQRLIFTSTASVFGPSVTAAQSVTETTIKTVPHTSAYEATKAEAEKLLKSYLAKGLEVLILNPTRVYGPGKESESNAVNKLINLYIQGKWRFLPGDGKSIGNYCFTEDVVAAHINAISMGKNGQNYLLGGHNISYIELFETVAQVTGLHYRLFKVPAKLLQVVSRLLVAGASLTNSKPLLTPKWLHKYLINWSVSSQKAQNELQYKITPLPLGLKKTIDHIKE